MKRSPTSFAALFAVGFVLGGLLVTTAGPGRPRPIDIELQILRATGGWNIHNSPMVG